MQMASRRSYAYYIRGSQLALVEHDSVSGDGQTLGQPSLDDIGPSGGLQWKSPVASITDGLEIEYAYSPRYTLPGSAGIDIGTAGKRFINGWLAIPDTDTGKSYLTLLRAKGGSGLEDWTNKNPIAGDYIVIGGNSKWNGLHKVRERTAFGRLILETEVSNDDVNSSDIFTTGGTQLDFETDDNSIFDGGGTNIYLGDHFSAGDYVWIEGCSNSHNNGLFSVSSVETSATAASSKVILGTKYGVALSGSITADGSVKLNDEYSASATIVDDTDEGDINIYRAYRDFSYIIIGVDVLNDEADTIDLPEYLAKGLVYYVKAKIAEDQGDIERKNYNMKEFRRILEKHESSKIRGPRMMIPGGHGIR